MHNLKLFAGPRSALKRFHTVAPGKVRAFALTRNAGVFAMPLEDDLHDILHGIYGTGEWLENGLRLSTGDLKFAAHASQGASLIYLEAEYFGATGRQGAAVWKHGTMTLKPTTHDDETHARRPLTLMPINTALTSIGIVGADGIDAFEAFGLANYRSNQDICKDAFEIDL